MFFKIALKKNLLIHVIIANTRRWLLARVHRRQRAKHVKETLIFYLKHRVSDEHHNLISETCFVGLKMCIVVQLCKKALILKEEFQWRNIFILFFFKSAYWKLKIR